MEKNSKSQALTSVTIPGDFSKKLLSLHKGLEAMLPAGEICKKKKKSGNGPTKYSNRSQFFERLGETGYQLRKNLSWSRYLWGKSSICNPVHWSVGISKCHSPATLATHYRNGFLNSTGFSCIVHPVAIWSLQPRDPGQVKGAAS